MSGRNTYSFHAEDRTRIALTRSPGFASSMSLQSRDAHSKVVPNSSTSQLRDGITLLFSSRRGFFQSLSKSAVILSLESILSSVGLPLRTSEESPKPAPGLGLSFVDIARPAGLNA